MRNEETKNKLSHDLEINIIEAFEKTSHGISVLLQEMKEAKSLAAKFNSNNEYLTLIEAGILKAEDSGLIINYEYPTCILISRSTQEDFSDEIPVHSLAETIPLSQKAVQSLNKTGITAGTGDFRLHLIAELILHAYSEKIDLSAEILELNRNSPRYFGLVNSLSLAIPKLHLPLLKLYDLYAHIYSLTYDDGASQSLFTSLQTFASKSGTALLDLAIQNNNKLPGFIANILLGLAEEDAETAWSELEKLSKIGYERETLNALTNTKIQSAEHVDKIFRHVKENYSETDATIPSLIWAYGHILKCAHTKDITKQECIESLKSFGKTNNEQIHLSLISIVNVLTVPEEIKLDIISLVEFRNQNLIHRLTHVASKFSVTNFFLIIRKMAEGLKLDFKPDEIHHYLSTCSLEKPEEFSRELIGMLSDKTGMIRLAGSRILQAVHSEHRPFHFKVDLLALSEHHQARVIKAILLDFLHPQDVIRFIIAFRDSKYQTVLQALVDALASVFEDYNYDAIIYLRKETDVTRDTDKQLLDIFEKYHTDLAAIITKKNSIDEFSPHKNQARAFYSFMKLSKHKMREKFSQDQEKHSVFGTMKTVSIARGKSWKIEGNGGDPSPLHEISSSIIYPRLCFMNPDQYNWDFMVNVNSNYKNG